MTEPLARAGAVVALNAIRVLRRAAVLIRELEEPLPFDRRQRLEAELGWLDVAGAVNFFAGPVWAGVRDAYGLGGVGRSIAADLAVCRRWLERRQRRARGARGALASAPIPPAPPAAPEPGGGAGGSPSGGAA